MDELIDAFLRDMQREAPQSPERVAIMRSLLGRFVRLADIDLDDGGLRVAATALDELLAASTLFAQWRDRPKLAVFGSARTSAESPLFEMARELGGAIAQRGWMVVSGAGPGIMEASAMGAGRESTLGVNIDLPFEQFVNPYIDAETMLVAMQYFFTRKVAMTRPSNGFAVFPGGLGTMDEVFEVLTLLHTGKSSPAPVILIDTPGGTYWSRWMDFVERAIVADGYVDEHDMRLVRVCHSVEEAVYEIEHFFSNYRSFELLDDRAYVRTVRVVTPEQVEDLARKVPRFARGDGYRLEDANTISFDFDGRNYVSLRLVIDEINAWH